MNVKAPRGTKDILFPTSLHWQYVEELSKKIFKTYNYQEIRTPVFEYTELFQRGIGELTDIVEKEMYTFDDKGGRSITLRPEGTASVMRAFLEHKIYGQAQPSKYYYCGPMFRYERPQAGRYRQFHQLGVEALGSNDPALDAEVIALGLEILENLGLKDYVLHLNSIACEKCRPNYIEQLKESLLENTDKLCPNCQKRLKKNPLRVLDCKNENCSIVTQNSPEIINHLCEHCFEHFEQVKKYLDILAIPYVLDPRLVRGLDYYTNTAFEVKYHGLGAQDTIFAGGRYNGLAQEIDGRDIPGIGFAIGLERLILTLEEQKIKLPVATGIDLFIVTIGNKAKEKAFNLTYQLRKAGLKTAIDYLDRSVKSQMKAADRMQANFTIILGESELTNGQATIRNMQSGEQEELSLDTLVKRMEELCD